MSNTIHYTHCPLCNSPDIHLVFTVKDYTVSAESFRVMACLMCSARFTQDIPDADSIASYYKSENYISHSNTSEGLINRLYQWVRKKTLKDKSKLVKRFTGRNKGSLLDIGSGTGAFVNEMKRNNWEVIGLEPEKDARTLGKQLFNIELDDINRLYNLPHSNYDAITMWHVLEHVHDLHKYISQVRSLLTENGVLFIAVPNYTSRDAALYQEYWAAYDVPRHLYHFSPYAMQMLMAKHELLIKAYKPMWYDSYYVSMLSSQYKNGKTNLLASSWNGLRSNLNAIGNPKNCSSVIYIITKKVPQSL